MSVNPAEILALLVAILIVGFSRYLWRRYEEFESLSHPAAGASSDPPLRVSVLVPARNEERNIRRCLSGLLNQTYSDYEIIVVDDHSTDRTPEILREFARDPRLRVVLPPPLPPGWSGKCHALWTGSRLATGDWLFFLDADTFARPELLAAAVAHAETHSLDIISLLPHQDLESLSEKIIQPVVFTVLQIFLPPARANDPDDPMGHVVGQCFGVRRHVYEAVQGHKNNAVRALTVDDAALGQVVKSAGYRLEIVNGRNLVHTRMYTDFGEIWNGWARVFIVGLGKRWLLLPAALLFSLATIAYLGLSVRVAPASGSGLAVAINGLTLLYLLFFFGLMRWKIGRIIGQPGWFAFTYPLGLMVVGGIAFTSMMRKLLGSGSEWKGRRYA